MSNENHLIKHLTGKAGLANTTVEDWEKITRQFPSFGAAQYFLAKKLQTSQHTSQEGVNGAQLKKTALYFADLYWLQFLLQSKDDTNQTENTLKTGVDTDEKRDESKKQPSAQAATSLNESNTLTSTQVIQDQEQTKSVTPQDFHDGLSPSRLSSLLEAQAAQYKKPVKHGEKLSVETEPLYKTDYFASQGILFAKNQDELGFKVKRFTDWLKDIKKNSNETPQLQTTPEEEKQIEKKAFASLQQAEVLTESMAEVLVQQGKMTAAIAVFKKLSLLYPEKSSYFASKIESLQ